MSVSVRRDLELDVAQLGDQAFDVERAVAESAVRLAPGLRDGVQKHGWLVHRLHADAAALGRLEQHREAHRRAAPAIASSDWSSSRIETPSRSRVASTLSSNVPATARLPSSVEAKAYALLVGKADDLDRERQALAAAGSDRRCRRSP